MSTPFCAHLGFTTEEQESFLFWHDDNNRSSERFPDIYVFLSMSSVMPKSMYLWALGIQNTKQQRNMIGISRRYKIPNIVTCNKNVTTRSTLGTGREQSVTHTSGNWFPQSGTRRAIGTWLAADILPRLMLGGRLERIERESWLCTPWVYCEHAAWRMTILKGLSPPDWPHPHRGTSASPRIGDHSSFFITCHMFWFCRVHCTPR